MQNNLTKNMRSESTSVITSQPKTKNAERFYTMKMLHSSTKKNLSHSNWAKSKIISKDSFTKMKQTPYNVVLRKVVAPKSATKAAQIAMKIQTDCSVLNM